MDAGLINQQKGAESSTSDATLSAQQFYQHDPLLMMLKDKLRLNDFWISSRSLSIWVAFVDQQGAILDP